MNAIFYVRGVPVAQGSKTIARHGDSVWLRDVNGNKLKQWRSAVREVAADYEPILGPVGVEIWFYMPKPRKPRFSRPAVRPDADKLTRAVLDSLTASGIIEDDSRVCDLYVHEHYVDGDAVVSESSALIRVWSL